MASPNREYPSGDSLEALVNWLVACRSCQKSNICVITEILMCCGQIALHDSSSTQFEPAPLRFPRYEEHLVANGAGTVQKKHGFLSLAIL
jgi:hypothetical protein